jgi:hypothetical protein
MRQSYRIKNNKDFTLSVESDNIASEETFISKDDLTTWNEDLLKNEEFMKYLADCRHVDEKTVRKFMLGYKVDDHGLERLLFPMFDAEGNCVNIKMYNPWEKGGFKWVFWAKGLPVKPVPLNNFMGPKLYFMEGEPDTYCANAYGLNAVTLGSAVRVDVDKIFGPETARMLLENKECVICYDADEAGKIGAMKLAKALYKYARQIKIIDLNKSDTNIYGLPDDTVDVDGKMKSKYKDFTDYMVKINGNGEEALNKFIELEKITAEIIVSRKIENLATELGVAIESSFYVHGEYDWVITDRKSTRLNSSHTT